MLAPLVVLSTVVVFASGVALLLRRALLALGAAAGAQGQLHRLARVHRACTCSATCPGSARCCEPTTARIGGGDTNGRAGRVLALSGALVAGVVLAILAVPEFAPWLHSMSILHHEG